MSAAAFVLAINLFVAGLFATAFGVLAAYYRSALGARWIAFGYGCGVVTSVLEFVLPFQADARPVAFALFSIFLFALAFIVIGLARHYRLSPPLRVLTGLVAVSMLINLFSMEMPRDSFLRAMLYQLPYALILLVALGMMVKLPARRILDVALMGILVTVIIHFIAKPFLAQMIGSGGAPQGYLSSTYAAISQSVGAILHISTGIAVLLIMVRDVMAEITARSETDALSGLHNRRGFEDHSERAMALSQRSGVPAMMIVADLDHFKQINDTHGHATGDMVIAAFAKTLREAAPQTAVLGRTGGEEFAIFLPGTNLACGRLYAEAVRTAFPVNVAPELKGLNLSASFGAAMQDTDDTLPELMRRADQALYRAKSEGRNRVVVAKIPPSALAAESGTIKDFGTS
jgi:diguanylate cyclase (GGDEF)-like protein